MLNLGNSSGTLNVVKRKSKSLNLSLRLTSMMDMFTILLVFLLKSFSAEGQIATVAADLTLPNSSSTKRPKASPIISITKEWILFDDKPLVKVSEITKRPDLLIPELDQALQFARSVAEGLGEQDKQLGFHGVVDIMGDRDTSFAIIKRVMFTCGKNGYNNMQLAVYGQAS